MPNPLELSVSQSFEKERFTRAINETGDVETLRQIATLLLQSWFTQRAATQWVIDQSLTRPATVPVSQITGSGFQIDDSAQ